jgi:hypothetical protein
MGNADIEYAQRGGDGFGAEKADDLAKVEEIDLTASIDKAAEKRYVSVIIVLQGVTAFGKHDYS